MLSVSGWAFWNLKHRTFCLTMRCFSDVLKKTLPCNVFGDVLEKVKHLTNDAFNDVSRPAPHPDPWNQRPRRPWSPHPQTDVCWYIWTSCSFIWARQSVPFPLCLSIPFHLFWPTFPAPFATSDDRWSLTFLQQTKLLPMKPYLLFAFLMAGRKSDPFIFPKIFTNSSAHPCHKYSQNLPSSAVLQKHRTLQEFWHIY